MADRLSSLRRIERVQAEMVKLAEWKLADAERTISAIGDDQARLRAYIDGSGALGVSLAQSALKSIQLLDRRLAEAERGRAAEKTKLDTLRRRDRAVGAMVESAAKAARSAAEATDLGVTMEAWLARGTTP